MSAKISDNTDSFFIFGVGHKESSVQFVENSGVYSFSSYFYAPSILYQIRIHNMVQDSLNFKINEIELINATNDVVEIFNPNFSTQFNQNELFESPIRIINRYDNGYKEVEEYCKKEHISILLKGIE